MTQEPLFVGYYTRDSGYEESSITLKHSLDALTLRHDIVGVPCRGSWQANTQLKADFLADMLKHHDGERLVFIDVDAIVVKRPALFWTLDCDLAAVMYDPTILLSGTLFMRANDKTRSLVARWRELNKMHPEKLPDGRDAWDQRTLLMAIDERMGANELKFVELPQSYTWMVGLTQTKYPDVDPIIMHSLASQRNGRSAWRR